MKLKLIGPLLLLWHCSMFSFASDVNSSLPFVLIHGCLGFEGEILEKNYWGDLPGFLQERGAKVYIANLSAVNDSSVRGQQLYAQLKRWGHEKYHLIGHSQGGLDARYLFHLDPNIVATVTTIATPHLGSPVADFIFNSVESLPLISNLVWRLGDLLGYLIGTVSYSYKNIKEGSQDIKVQFHDASMKIREICNLGCIANFAKNIFCTTSISHIIDKTRSLISTISIFVRRTSAHLCHALGNIYNQIPEQDAKKAVLCLTSQASKDFNSIYSTGMSSEESKGRFYSWGTHSVCSSHKFDVIALIMQVSGRLFFGSVEKNDGVVAIESMKFGQWLGELPGAHHLVAANNGLGSFPKEHVDWFRDMFNTLLQELEEDCQP